ncbi:NAD-dependent malic enzyme [Thermoclostridium stercorarium subsp. stercorarium DSM 8532]|jgi:malate dehydrogenase (oxaloacetate-decarboxylating)|uniref:NAD-dependent malic enzyme n=3 Tax=Thermoclostridium stercorarium TaxID=1510 RepID=L7VN81_THES1|nr:NADP-dependent malic enzyme [Thermoclostridium stercorarium]AGC69670.1 NAD-dependent malic enzyme [Thermoclostridium stercorarium subsp. stercorarium DSM 8532]AGI40622.1 Mle [Thermoclostridium stercorarium subsp. stercorarium DSM 8532]ANW99892.1 malate dehydrogenase [Thermoclostridium stercorarium subsp. thermolacticum DSM 2910]ANX02516.1 malate dehydrogenase [Thermoclostridium stercorarium subsp. leptospartum DSM 9219]UZQ85608.1 NADP-dependent malic enzyme [Thermoclostridium stercorarium]
MSIQEEALELHRRLRGKIEIVSRVEVKDRKDLSLAYTPGVAQPCIEIQKDINLSYELTRRWNTVAVITDGTAVLGLGDIGPEAGMPVMEGKCVLFKLFGGVDAFPLCIRSKDVDEIVNTIKLIAGSFGGINLEDISSPRCFEIERRLKKGCDIPIFHDDQHGTAVVVLAALINALKIVKKDIRNISVVVNGAGAAGIAITRLLMSAGLKNVILCDRHGAIYEGCEFLNSEQALMAKVTNREKKKGTLADVLVGADVFIGVSGPNVLTGEMVRSMAKDPIVFAMANPVPEIMPDEAKAAGARVVGTGRSDFANQINNVLAFPGIFRGALDVRARDINDEMKIAASEAIASLVSDEELSPDYIIPAAFDPRVGEAVAKAVAEAARKSGVARI